MNLRCRLIDSVRTRLRALVVCVAVAVLVGGCEMPGVIYSSIRYPVGLLFVDAATGQSVLVRSGQMRESVIGVGTAGGCLTLERTGRMLRARTRVANGAILWTREIPLVTEAYAGHDVIASPDLNQIVYHDYRQRSLWLYELDSGKRRELLPDVSAGGAMLGYMRFTRLGEIVVVVARADGTRIRTSEVKLVDTDARATRTIAQLADAPLSYHFNMSRDGRYLVAGHVQFRRTEPSTLRVFDLHEAREVTTVRDIGIGYIGCAAISDDGRAITWYRHGRNTGTLVTAALAPEATPREVRSYADQSVLWLNAVGDDTVVFTRSRRGDKGHLKRLVTVNLTTGEERVLGEHGFNGSIVVMRPPMTFVCATGY